MEFIIWAPLIVLSVGICLTYKIKNAFLRWLLILTPPLLIVPLYRIQQDILSMIVWLPAYIAFIWSIVSIIINIVRIIFIKLRKKPYINYVKVRFVRPVLTIVIFLFVNFIVNQSLRSADEFAKQMGRKIQDETKINGVCPKTIQDWEVDKYDPNINITWYGKYGTKYPLKYYTSENGKEFNIRVYHSIDRAFHVSGGVDRKLAAIYSGHGKDVNVPIE
jgi:hypothetical protein